jgi:hypothetical protein
MFAARMPEWKRCRDAVAGSDAVKAAGPDYLPRLGGQGIVDVEVPGGGVWQINEYEAYKTRANWYNATAAAVNEMQGALFRTPPIFDVPDPMKAHLADITMTGESAASFAKRLAGEVITVGLFGVLVDLPTNILTPHPYWTGYRAEQILRAIQVNRDGIWVLGQLVLEECTTEPGDEEFEEVEVTRWRVLELDADGYLVVRRFEQPDGRSKPVEVEALQPNVRKQRLRGIPFVPFGPTSLLPTPDISPILDLVDINYSHYRTSADLEEALHKLAVPTPWAAGFPVDTVLRLGANVAHVTNNEHARMGMLEFTGAGLGELRGALQHKEEQMDAIRARLMARQKGGVESAEAIRLRTSGEQNVLMTLSTTLSQGLTRLLGYHAEWMGLRHAVVSAQVNDDFLDHQLSPQEQAENRADYQARLISYDTWYYRSQKGEITRPGVTADEERALIESEDPLAGEIDLIPEETDQQEDNEDAA